MTRLRLDVLTYERRCHVKRNCSRLTRALVQVSLNCLLHAGVELSSELLCEGGRGWVVSVGGGGGGALQATSYYTPSALCVEGRAARTWRPRTRLSWGERVCVLA